MQRGKFKKLSLTQNIHSTGSIPGVHVDDVDGETAAAISMLNGVDFVFAVNGLVPELLGSVKQANASSLLVSPS